MTRDPSQRSANDAAWLVTGTVGDTTIEAVALSGTTYNGSVTLRITVNGSGGFDDNTTIACYSYHFAHTLHDATPTSVHCPTTGPITLTSPAAQPDLTSALEIERFRTVLTTNANGLPGLTSALKTTFPSPVRVAASYIQNGVIQANVNDTNTCLVGYVQPSHKVTITSGSGEQCSS